MARFSISGKRAADGGWPLDEVPDSALAAMLDIPHDRVAAHRAALTTQLRDPAWVARAIDALPAATLAILQLLSEGGGIALDAEVARTAQERYGISTERYRLAALPALRAALVVPLTTRDAGSAIALLQPAAPLVSALVEDLDVLPRPPEAFTARDAALGDARLFLALCVAAGHMDLKLTMDGQLHRGTVKRLAKQAGADDRLADRMLSFALHMRFLVRDGDFARPDLETLFAAARAEYPASTGLPALQAMLADGPLDRDTLFRWSQRHSLVQVERLLLSGGLAYLPGFSEGTIDGAGALAYRAPAGSASGHVTPSFEVILPPECCLIDIVQVGACCEWVRLDRAIVARITKPSIMRALGAGASPAQILGWLTAVSRNPLPQNVEVAVRDWTGTTAPATLATGHVVVIEPAAEPRALAALGKLAARKLAPGVIVIDDKHPAREVERALVLAGVFVRPDAPARSRKRADDAADAPSRGDHAAAADRAGAAPSRGNARLRAKIAAWRRGEPFEGARDDFLDEAAPLNAPRPAWEPISAPAGRTTAQHVKTQLAEWATRNRAARVSVDDTVADLLAMLPVGAFEAQLSRTQDPDVLLKELARLLVRSGLGRPDHAESPRTRGTAPRARSQPPRRSSPLPLAWQRGDLRPRLEAAARREACVALEVNGEVRYVAIERVTRRGTAWLVLGEDLLVEIPVALPLDAITAIAELPEDFEPTDSDDDDSNDDGSDDDDRDGGGQVVRRPWRPAPGQAIPAGHLPCPCGSGARYRSCCRGAAQA